MSLQNSFPHDYEDIGHIVFPLPNKSIRVDDPNYIHYVPDRSIANRNDPREKKESTQAYVAPAGDDSVILRTYVSQDSFRKSRLEAETPRPISAEGEETNENVHSIPAETTTSSNSIRHHQASIINEGGVRGAEKYEKYVLREEKTVHQSNQYAAESNTIRTTSTITVSLKVPDRPEGDQYLNGDKAASADNGAAKAISDLSALKVTEEGNEGTQQKGRKN